MDKEKKDKLLLLCNEVTKKIDSSISISLSLTIEGHKIYCDVIDIAFDKYLYIKYNNAIYYDSKEPYKDIEGVFYLDYNDEKNYDILDSFDGFSGQGCIEFCHIGFWIPKYPEYWYPIHDGYDLIFYYFYGSHYDNYMKSEEWDKKRDAAYKRAGYTCEECYKTGVKLNAHHKTYSNFGHEKEEDIIVLCDDCHAKKHLDNKYFN